MNDKYLKYLLDTKTEYYNSYSFIETDPIQIPHRFSETKDIEISGFFASQLAWGNRKNIIKSASCLMSLMDNSPFEWIKNSSENDFKVFEKFVYRTFNYSDTIYYIKKMKQIIDNYGSMGQFFEHLYISSQGCIKEVLIEFFKFFMNNAPQRTQKHLANVSKGSAAKRLNLFLRWMVRSDSQNVDFGLWKFIPTSILYIPLDVHSGRIARKLGLLTRKTNDWKSVEELTDNLKKFDFEDPVKYDFALFGLGVFERY